MCNLKRFRKQVGLTQEKMARELKVGIATYLQWEYGNSTPHVRKCYQIIADLERLTNRKKIRIEEVWPRECNKCA